MVAGDTGPGHRGALGPLARPSRPEPFQQPPLLRRHVRARPADGSNGALAIDLKYREAVERHGVKPTHLPRFVEIHGRSGAFESGAVDVINPSRLSMIWLEHLLLLSMLQHESGRWTWGRYIVLHLEANIDIAHTNDEYRKLLTADATFTSATIEDLLAAVALAPNTASALQRRYLPKPAAVFGRHSRRHPECRCSTPDYPTNPR